MGRLEMSEGIQYSNRYADNKFEYRHVTIPLQLTKIIPDDHSLLAEHEWRSLGIQQSRGWTHYGYHPIDRSVLLFRRELPRDLKPMTSSSEVAFGLPNLSRFLSTPTVRLPRVSQIGRAVQQECRDRSRMPSSA
eukprot:TRINITY_DN47997_c0_g1_i1.p1 TRINITY_DN47997_c0_g1~~TRINITY_DN47997_c0_g1_i1.p1  ORF type:complete len:134 (+),score=9.75 TRINITY_DN47997_c0_g1_i1:90-491(+)